MTLHFAEEYEVGMIHEISLKPFAVMFDPNYWEVLEKYFGGFSVWPAYVEQTHCLFTNTAGQMFILRHGQDRAYYSAIVHRNRWVTDDWMVKSSLDDNPKSLIFEIE